MLVSCNQFLDQHSAHLQKTNNYVTDKLYICKRLIKQQTTTARRSLLGNMPLNQEHLLGSQEELDGTLTRLEVHKGELGACT